MNALLLNIFSDRLIKEELSKIIGTNTNIIKINYDESNIDNIIEECSYISLIEEEKIVIVNNFKIDKESKLLEEYLKNKNDYTKLILIVNNIDKRSTLYKLFKENKSLIEIQELKDSELKSKINLYCKNNSINLDFLALNKLMEDNLFNYDLILNEIDKISIITKGISLKEIELYGFKLIGEENFDLADAITSKNIKKSNQLLEDFIESKEEVIPFVALLANQYRIILSTLLLEGSNEKIASIINVHPYRVKLSRDKSKLYNEKELKNILLELYELDRSLKSSNINQYTLFRKFIIEIRN